MTTAMGRLTVTYLAKCALAAGDSLVKQDQNASGGLCNATNHCLMQSSGDGAVSCVDNGKTWKHPLSVWRGQTFQAETATLGGGAAVQTDPSASAGARVSWSGPLSTVTFRGVRAAATGTNNLVVYDTNGDTTGQRYFDISVNGGAVQNKAFVPTASWSATGQLIVTLSGFVAGSTNTIQFRGDGSHAAPDLDWIEVVAGTATH
jgi:hypothetical protein